MTQVSAARRSTQVHSTTSSQPTVRLGSRGPSVALLQQKLRAAGFDPHGVDGVFGAHTQAAVVAYQRSRHLSVDGVVGPNTWGALLSGRPAQGGAPVDSYSGGGASVLGYVNGRPVHITVASIGNGKTLRTDAAGAYNRMMSAARSAGLNLSAVSGFRTMAQQQSLYDLYRSGRGNLAARPGYSNHQGGIAADIGNIGGYGTRAYTWLRAHASTYGFVNDVPGEPWHWTYRR